MTAHYRPLPFRVARTDPDGLTEVVWTFELHRTEIVLKTYREFSRPAKRHKFRLIPRREYCRLNHDREYRYQTDFKHVSDVPLPVDVLVQVKREIQAMIKFDPAMLPGRTIFMDENGAWEEETA